MINGNELKLNIEHYAAQFEPVFMGRFVHNTITDEEFTSWGRYVVDVNDVAQRWLVTD